VITVCTPGIYAGCLPHAPSSDNLTLCLGRGRESQAAPGSKKAACDKEGTQPTLEL